MQSASIARKFLSTKELSRILDIPEGTLRQWRSSGVGPKWHKLRGSVRYDMEHVELFIHESERSPSVRASRRNTLPLFQPPDSRYWWYSFYFEGKRYRSSTKQTKKTAAAVVEATLFARLRECEAHTVRTKKPPTLREFSTRFLHWVENSQRLSPNGKRYYRFGWRLLSYSTLAGMRIDQITQDIAESVVFCRPAIDRKKKDNDGKYLIREELIPCSGHYTNQALRTLKRMQSKALEWKVLRETPKIILTNSPGRDQLINDRTEDDLELAYRKPIKPRRTKLMRDQAWLVLVILQDCGMRPDEVFPLRIENLHWDANRIWIPQGKTPKARRFVAMSERVKMMLRQWCADRREGWVFPSPRSKSGPLTTIAKGFQAARNRAGLDKKLVPYSARHTYGTYAMEKSRNAFAVAKSMGHVDLKSMEPYQHQELEPLREIIDQRNQRKKFGQVLENEEKHANNSRSISA